MMRAVRVSQFGGPEVLKVENNLPLPVPTKTQVLVEVKAAGINPVDAYVRSGTFAVKPTLPYIPGSDAAGIVKDVGAAVTKFKLSDRVYTQTNLSGSYAEYVVAEERYVGHLGDRVTFQQGSAVGIPYYTAYMALCLKAKDKFKPGCSVLIHGASGAVGQACVQLCVSRGITVYGTAGSQEGLDLILKQGATAVFNHREEGYSKKILEATRGEGPDIIVEMLANVNLETDLQLINRKGTIVLVGSRGTAEISPVIFMIKQCIVTGLTVMNATEDEWTEMHTSIEEGLKTGWVQPQISKEYTLDEAPLAHDEIMNSLGTLGKRVFVL